MHYYKRNIGDYAKKAGRLSMLEHGAYTLLIDACYDRERFPTEAEAIEWAWARSDAEIEAVRFVLSRFFVLTDGLYVQDRINDEVVQYQRNAETNARIATEREEKRRSRERSVNGSCKDVNEPPPNQEPRTNNQEPPTRKDKTRKPRPQSDDFVSVDDLVAEGVDAQVAKDWLRVRKDKQQRTLTKTAWATVKAESVKAGMALDESLREAVARGWAGFKASWLDNSTPQSRPGFVMAEKPLSPAERQMYAASPTRCNDRVKRMMAAELGNNAPHIVDNIIEMDQGYGTPTLLG